MKWFDKKNKNKSNKIIVRHSKDDIRIYPTPSSILNMDIKQVPNDTKIMDKESQ